MGRRISMNIRHIGARWNSVASPADMQVYPKQTPRSADQAPPKFTEFGVLPGSHLRGGNGRESSRRKSQRRVGGEDNRQYADESADQCSHPRRSSRAAVLHRIHDVSPKYLGGKSNRRSKSPARSAGDARTRPAPLSLRQPASPESAQPRSGCRRPWVFPIIIFGSRGDQCLRHGNSVQLQSITPVVR